MDTAVIEYRKRRQMRLDARSEGEEAQSTNQQNQRPVNHGNTKLPFGLCKKYGIAVEKGWTPRDAWSALADKGVTPNEEFSKRKGKSTFKALGYEYRNIHSVKKDDGQYSLYGDFDDVSPFSGRKESHTNSKYCDFICKDEMLSERSGRDEVQRPGHREDDKSVGNGLARNGCYGRAQEIQGTDTRVQERQDRSPVLRQGIRNNRTRLHGKENGSESVQEPERGSGIREEDRLSE